MNLAVADIMFATFIAPMRILELTSTHHDGLTGKVLCKLLRCGNLAWIGSASSVVTLVNIAIERYYVVLYPYHNKGYLNRRKLKVCNCKTRTVYYFQGLVKERVAVMLYFMVSEGGFSAARNSKQRYSPNDL